MVKQYPHSAFISIPATAVQDANGNWVESVGTGSETEIACRLEPRLGKNNAYVEGSDGARIEVKAVIYLPKTAPQIQVGSRIRVMEGATTLVDTTVKQYSRGQLNARAWI